MYPASIPQSTILVTNRWNRSCFSWISPNFLHSLFPPLFSLKCAPSFLPQCWATRTLEHWDDCNTQINIGEGENHTSVDKCFKICDEYCSSVMIRNLALYVVQPKIIRNLRWYRLWILDFSSRLIYKIQSNLHVRPPVVNDKLREKIGFKVKVPLIIDLFTDTAAILN